MCIIVDNNVATLVLCDDKHPDYGCIHRALFSSTGPNIKLVYCEKLKNEYIKNDKIRQVLLALDRAGRTRTVCGDDITRTVDLLIKSALCKSNDLHILSLAIVSKVRLICTNDHALIDDFTNGNILRKPRGKVYKDISHKSLLFSFCK